MQPDLHETNWSPGAVARAVPKRRRIWRKLMVSGLLAVSASLQYLAVLRREGRGDHPGLRQMGTARAFIWR